jgi:hypothetical protein
MLKELNKIAAGMLGLHGYPVQPWTAPAQGATDCRSAQPAGEEAAIRNPRRTSQRPRPASRTARAWR